MEGNLLCHLFGLFDHRCAYPAKMQPNWRSSRKGSSPRKHLAFRSDAFGRGTCWVRIEFWCCCCLSVHRRRVALIMCSILAARYLRNASSELLAKFQFDQQPPTDPSLLLFPVTSSLWIVQEFLKLSWEARPSTLDDTWNAGTPNTTTSGIIRSARQGFSFFAQGDH